jgi:hypothetical protein
LDLPPQGRKETESRAAHVDLDQHEVRFGPNREVRMLNPQGGFALNTGRRQPSLSGPNSAHQRQSPLFAHLYVGNQIG